jgi:hypothetical protein
MSLPNGVFLVSNIMYSPDNPVFAEYVRSPVSEREKQWDKIVSLGCNGRLCRVFKDEEEAMTSRQIPPVSA